MKKNIGIGILAGMMLLTVSCSKQAVEKQTEKVVPVEVRKITEEERSLFSTHIGTIQPGKTVQLSFKNGGRVEALFVEKGDKVKKGETLAVLEKTDLEYAANLAKSQVEMVQAQYEKASNGATSEDLEQARLNVVKATDAYQYAVDRFKEVEGLYLSGTASKQVYDQTRLEVNIRKSDLSLAEELEAQVKKGARYEEIKALSAQLESAKTEYNYRKALLDETTLRASIDGTVMEVLSEKGQMTGSGYPVVVLRNEEQLIHVGVTEKDLKHITLETKVIVEKDDQKTEGEIVRIAEVPDNMTGLYNIEVKAGGLTAPFGATATVRFLKAEEKGFYIPITSILHDGEDYIYTVSDGRVVRKDISIVGMDNFEARVTGLSNGDLLILSGAGRVSDGDSVTVKED